MVKFFAITCAWSKRASLRHFEAYKSTRNVLLTGHDLHARGLSKALFTGHKRFSGQSRTLYLIDEGHELEEFVAVVPGLSESEALR
jgi:hypothetical protein